MTSRTRLNEAMSEPRELTPHGAQDPPTTLHVRRAMDGDVKSLTWVVARFSPLLLAQAHYRLGERLRRLYDPEDLVNDVWAVALPRFAGLSDRDGRHTPVLLRFLSTTLLYRFNNLVQKHITGKPAHANEDEGGPDAVRGMPQDTTGVVSRVLKDEVRGTVLRAIDELDPNDREVIVLRAIEQNPNHEVATLLGEAPNTVAVRYKRALKKLQKRLPDSVFAEL